MDELKIQEERVEPNFSDDKKMLQELKERLVREHEEKEKKARRREKWRRILRLGFFSKK
jgi:hypothetical protein